MKRVRQATCGALAWATVAGLGLLSGCSSMDPCCRPGLFDRLGCRSRTMGTMGPIYEAPTSGVPFTGEFPMGMSDCCNGGMPPSAMPGESLYSGPILGDDYFHGPSLPPSGKMGAPFMPPSGPFQPMPGSPYAPSSSRHPAAIPPSGRQPTSRFASSLCTLIHEHHRP
jgi:hypothetical protein